MEVNNNPNDLLRVLPTEPNVGISNVAQSMADVRAQLNVSGYSQFEPFAFSYHAVTRNIEDKVELQRTHGITYYKQPQVLDTAMGIFEYEYTRQFSERIAGNEVKAPWRVLMDDERVQRIDKGTQAALGYNAHIVGDLPITVYKTASSGTFSPEVMSQYIKHDYPKIDKSLAETALKIAPMLVEIDNEKARNAVVKIALGGIVVARQQALRDFRKLVKASSEDERLSLQHSAEQRGARLGMFILNSSYSAQRLLGKYPTEQRIIDLAA